MKKIVSLIAEAFKLIGDETILETVLRIITRLLSKAMGLDLNEMHAVIEDCKGNPSPPFINIINIDIVNKNKDSEYYEQKKEEKESV